MSFMNMFLGHKDMFVMLISTVATGQEMVRENTFQGQGKVWNFILSQEKVIF